MRAGAELRRINVVPKDIGLQTPVCSADGAAVKQGHSEDIVIGCKYKENLRQEVSKSSRATDAKSGREQ